MKMSTRWERATREKARKRRKDARRSSIRRLKRRRRRLLALRRRKRGHHSARRRHPLLRRRKNLKLTRWQSLLRRIHSPGLLHWSMIRRHFSRGMMQLTTRVSIQALPKVMKMDTRSLTRLSKLCRTSMTANPRSYTASGLFAVRQLDGQTPILSGQWQSSMMRLTPPHIV